MSNQNQCDTLSYSETVTTMPFPFWKLFAFTMAGFLTIMTETIPAGLLSQLSHDLQISEVLAGQLITIYALGSVIAAIPVVAMTRKLNRRPLFLSAIGALFIFNSATAVSADYTLTLIARFIAGMAAGVIWGLFAGYARRLVPSYLQGKALALASVGQPIALCIGVPLGTFLGALFDWRGVFWIMSGIALILLFWIRFVVPDFSGQSEKQKLSVYRVFCLPGVRAVLFTLLAWILAHNILYTFIAPYLSNIAATISLEIILLIFGVSCLIGIWIIGLLVDRGLRMLTLVSLLLFAISAIFFMFAQYSFGFLLVGVITWGISFGGAPTLLQTALADSADEHADVAQSMLVTIFNLAVAGGGIVGGLLLDSLGAGSFPVVLLVLSLAAFIMVYFANKAGFRAGARE
ncbi:MFS transporter [Xenorhabdus khoisanae]|uniref:MFS transporter n=1 Tax=Xenorhabdus khoisanae TaxID=880157 RepID=UPI002358AB46|nr:MFS transporter [Xenorhabdus khoisanae]MDC9615012.1 MFS transporter [Xenorhabdus khoisanae]